MLVSILTLFPDMFVGVFEYSILKRAQAEKLLTIEFINIRDFATNNYGTVDDTPYGGGIGMIMKVDVIDRAINATKSKSKSARIHTILTDPKGTSLTQKKVSQIATYDQLIIVCGHYEGVDARVSELVDESISVGSYILTGGELAAMILVDATTRLIPGVFKKSGVAEDESFSENFLEYEQYTRPAEYKSLKVPEVLLSGNHQEIKVWRAKSRKQVSSRRK